MQRNPDLSGKKFGEWTVLERDTTCKRGAGHHIRWLCQCSCGKIKSIRVFDIVHETTKSCGHNHFNDLTGKKFGLWTVIERGEDYVPEGKSRDAMCVTWRCRCECGVERNVLSRSLVSGQSTSCGQCLNNIVGKQFGRLTVIELAFTKNHTRYWRCKCSCGNYKNVQTSHLKSGAIQSCGCLQRELTAQRSTKHNGAKANKKERLYNVWCGIKERCNNPNQDHYHSYGGRGIRICEEWENDYSAFREWALSNGYDENAIGRECTIDRIDVNGNYCPENCRWVDQKIQSLNKTTTLYFDYNGKRMTLKEIAEEAVVNYKCLYSRIHTYHWTLEDAMSIPLGGKRKQ